MQVMKRLIIFLTVIVALSTLFTAKNALADQYQYNGSTTTVNILIDKKVSVPDNSVNANNASFVDNLFDFNARFTPGQNIFFRLRVKNTSNITLTNVQIKDFFPASFVETVGGAGTFVRIDNKPAVLINIGTLQPDQENVSFIQLKALSSDRLPGNGVFCGAQGVVNRVQVTSDQGANDDDTAQFCIENGGAVKNIQNITTFTKGGIPVKIPSTGPEMNLIVIAGEALTLAAGLFLKKISK